MGKRKKRWTTKNTHLRKVKKKEGESEDRMLKIASWIFLALAV